jgi:hypothetical protein
MKDRTAPESPKTGRVSETARQPYVQPMLREFGSAVELTLNFVSKNMNDTMFSTTRT